MSALFYRGTARTSAGSEPFMSLPGVWSKYFGAYTKYFGLNHVFLNLSRKCFRFSAEHDRSIELFVFDKTVELV